MGLEFLESLELELVCLDLELELVALGTSLSQGIEALTDDCEKAAARGDRSVELDRTGVRG